MKRNKALDFVLLLFCSCFVSVVAQDPHVHGDVNLNIVKDNSQLEIDLISPSVNIIGFEHAVSTNEERMVIEKANNLLAQHELIFSFQDEPCEHSETVVVQSGPTEKNKVELDHHDHHHAHKKDPHSDFEVQYRYECSEELYSLLVNLADYFSGVSQINVRWMNEGKQGAATLSNGRRKILF